MFQDQDPGHDIYWTGQDWGVGWRRGRTEGDESKITEPRSFRDRYKVRQGTTSEYESRRTSTGGITTHPLCLVCRLSVCRLPVVRGGWTGFAPFIPPDNPSCSK